MSTSNFMEQIREDIQLIKRDYGHLDANLQRDEFAFNYWILSRLFNLDEDVIPDNVIDIHDGGIDCFVHYGDTKELYIIQNKYYSADTAVNSAETAHFLENPLAVLLDGNYTHCPELQRIFNSAYADSEYKIWLHFYVTNDLPNKNAEQQFRYFASPVQIAAHVGARYYKLSDISMIYYGKRFTEKVRFVAKLTTKFAGTSLNVYPEDYKLPWMIPLRFMMVNVVELYKVYQEALKKNYQLFDENIREYLGASKEGSINNGIIKTLLNPDDRENFFYYNNGITIICEEISTLRGFEVSNDTGAQNQYGFRLTNPQIINGCQTINSIFEALRGFKGTPQELQAEYQRAFVLVKIYVFDAQTRAKKTDLEQRIVRFTNSQNGIDEKAFASKIHYFLNLQREFKERGMLLLVKPSDKNTFQSQYKDKANLAQLKTKGEGFFSFFDLSGDTLKSRMIPLEKLLKSLLAFHEDGYKAFYYGSSVLRPNTSLYKDFSLNIAQTFTIDNMLFLYLLFMKADADRKKSDDKRKPIPYYVLSFLGSQFKNLDYNQRNEKLKSLFSDKGRLMSIYRFYSDLTYDYSEDYEATHGQDYNRMITQDIDTVLLDSITKKAARHAGADIQAFLK